MLPGWFWRSVSVIATVVFLGSGCATRFTKVENFAAEHGFQSEVVRGDPFVHRVYRRPGSAENGVSLNVYIEGDGTPYSTRWDVALDPTPSNPVMLKLMALDPGPAVYVGRPCYFDTRHEPPCHPYYWTLGRFSPEVVASLAVVIRSEASRTAARELRIFGHSGGGALAVLVTRVLDDLEITDVVTLAGNLDHAEWTQLHGFTPLSGSLNPVDGGPLAESTQQKHLYGELDRNIPPSLMKKAAEDDLGGLWGVAPGVQHTCCWEAVWPALLAGQLPD